MALNSDSGTKAKKTMWDYDTVYVTYPQMSGYLRIELRGFNELEKKGGYSLP